MSTVHYISQAQEFTYNHYSEQTVFVDVDSIRLCLSPDGARKLWSALDAHFANEGNDKPMIHSGHYDGCSCGDDGSLVDPEGNVVPFVADHV